MTFLYYKNVTKRMSNVSGTRPRPNLAERANWRFLYRGRSGPVHDPPLGGAHDPATQACYGSRRKV